VILTPEEFATQSSRKACSHVWVPVHRRAYHVTVFDNKGDFGITISLRGEGHELHMIVQWTVTYLLASVIEVRRAHLTQVSPTRGTGQFRSTHDNAPIIHDHNLRVDVEKLGHISVI
jgi:hypothetical protein